MFAMELSVQLLMRVMCVGMGGVGVSCCVTYGEVVSM